jgi:hypothetical protein
MLHPEEFNPRTWLNSRAQEHLQVIRLLSAEITLRSGNLAAHIRLSSMYLIPQKNISNTTEDYVVITMCFFFPSCGKFDFEKVVTH